MSAQPAWPYQPTWNSLKTYTTPRWFQEAKFGIYTHWGVYSVPAFRAPGISSDVTWYGHQMYRPGTAQYEHHLKTYGGPTKFGYKDFIPMFTAEKFDPDEWAELFQQSGARFAGPVGEHHDGFCMWDTRYSEWSAAKMGPKRDVVGQLEKAIRRQGLKFLVALHHAENWWFYPHWVPDYDTADPRYAGLYGEPHNVDGQGLGPDTYDQAPPSQAFLQRWRDKFIELVDRYGPDVIYFDAGLRYLPDRPKQEIVAYFYNQAHARGQAVVVTKKKFDLAPGVGVWDLEAGRMATLAPHDWITDTTIDNSKAWGYYPQATYKSTTSLVHYLIDNVSKNGYLLLNVGPRPDGTLPEENYDVLRGIGRWLAVNGEAIFGTTGWITHGEGPTQSSTSGSGNEKEISGFTAQDIRFTSKDNVLYAACLGWPGAHVTIGTLKRFYPGEIETIRLLGSDQPLRWRLDATGLTIETPAQRPCEHAYVFKIVCGRPYEFQQGAAE